MAITKEQENNLIELRRSKVSELLAKGYSNQSEIARTLNVSEPTVCRDIQHIREHARASIREYIDVKLPQEYNNCLEGLRSILREAWDISKTADNREKLQALSLAKECYNSKLDLLTNVTVVEDVIKFVNKSKGLENLNISEEEKQDQSSQKMGTLEEECEEEIHEEYDS